LRPEQSRHHELFREFNLNLAAPGFQRKIGAGVIDQHSTHRLRCDGRELSLVLPIAIGLPNQAQIGFVDQRRGLQGVLHPFLAHEMRCQPPGAGLDKDFGLRSPALSFDYGMVRIGTQDYLLPLRSVLQLRHTKAFVRNETVFRGYRKFEAESEIKFHND